MKRLYSLLTGILVVVVLLGAGFFIYKNMGGGAVIKDSGDGLSDYSAVFVNGGGIYFGKITKMDGREIILEEVYNYGIVPAEDEEGNTSANNANGEQATRPTLFDASKVGIAPASRYRINRDQVILWYSLKSDSDVVKTIDEYKRSK